MPLSRTARFAAAKDATDAVPSGLLCLGPHSLWDVYRIGVFCRECKGAAYAAVSSRWGLLEMGPVHIPAERST